MEFPEFPFRPLFLWTDVLVFLLTAGVVYYFIRVRRDPNQSATWLRALRNPSGMASAVILGVFVLVGLLDSLHFRPLLPPQPAAAAAPAKDAKDAKAAAPVAVSRYAPTAVSVLDVILRPFNLEGERTYSEPLATHAFVKENREENGRTIRDFPRLKVAAQHLKNPVEDWAWDVTWRGVCGLLLGLFMTVVAAAFLSGILMRYPAQKGLSFGTVFARLWKNELSMPWRAAILALGGTLLLVGLVITLAPVYHVLGTDKVGKSLLYLSMKSIRTALVIGTLTTLFTLPFALLLGIAAGYFKGRVDDIIQYIYTTLHSIPSVLLIAASVLILSVQLESRPELFSTAAERADLRLFFLCVILGMTSWTGLCRLLRGETLKLRELEYIQAAQAFGVSHFRIIWRHILPNVMHLILISVVMEFSGLVLAEAVLSYVGVGVDPSMISFGTMINAARMEMSREPVVWWSLTAAFCFMFVLVLAANLFADSVRDAFDPRTHIR